MNETRPWGDFFAHFKAPRAWTMAVFDEVRGVCLLSDCFLFQFFGCAFCFPLPLDGSIHDFVSHGTAVPGTLHAHVHVKYKAPETIKIKTKESHTYVRSTRYIPGVYNCLNCFDRGGGGARIPHCVRHCSCCCCCCCFRLLVYLVWCLVCFSCLFVLFPQTFPAQESRRQESRGGGHRLYQVPLRTAM